MIKKIFLFIIILIGIWILGSCSNSIKNNKVNDITVQHQQVSQSIIDSEEHVDIENENSEKHTDIENENKDRKLSQQEKSFSDREIDTFKLIKEYYPEFQYSNFYVDTSEDDKKMVFTKQDDLYFGTFISYEVFYHDEGIINYFFDAGTIYRGYGSYYIIDENTVIKIEKSAGTSA